MTEIIRAPQKLMPTCGRKTLFLAGGITNVRDWQNDLCEMLSGWPNLLIFNPRRETAPEDAREQIVWEWEALQRADAISFWFSNETLQPITLLELGRWTAYTEPQTQKIEANKFSIVMGTKRLFVGVHPEYARKFDVEVQLSLQCPGLFIVHRLEDLAEQIGDWCNAGHGAK